ncbi:MAG: hypothetical protein M3394_00820 [Actinomycetota bacterium]|nr:hypothetical protein [Actinomycetota bacterium]
MDSLHLGGGERLQHLWELRHLNHHWDFDAPDPGQFGGPTVKGRAKGAIGRFVVHLFAKYFDDQREFYAHVVRVANALARSHDALADDLATLTRMLRDETQRLADRDAMFHALVEERLERMERILAGGTTAS